MTSDSLFDCASCHKGLDIGDKETQFCLECECAGDQDESEMHSWCTFWTLEKDPLCRRHNRKYISDKRKEKHIHRCCVCTEPLGGKISMICHGCKKIFHLKCGVRDTEKTRQLCNTCSNR